MSRLSLLPKLQSFNQKRLGFQQEHPIACALVTSIFVVGSSLFLAYLSKGRMSTQEQLKATDATGQPVKASEQVTISLVGMAGSTTYSSWREAESAIADYYDIFKP